MNEKFAEKYGDKFQQQSKYTRGNLPRHYLNWSTKPDTFKSYPDAEKIIELPKPKFNREIDFWKVILGRHSTRRFSDNSITLDQVSQLLFGMCGLTRIYKTFSFRTTPSAGGLYPIEVYPSLNNVEDMDAGIYHYNIENHQLERLKKGDYREAVTKGCLDQRIAYDSAVNFIFSAVITRSKWKYLQRCYRYIYLDAGHVGQNLYLVAEALKLGVCTIGAIYDDDLNNLLGLDGEEETVIYVGCVGLPMST